MQDHQDVEKPTVSSAVILKPLLREVFFKNNENVVSGKLKLRFPGFSKFHLEAFLEP